MDLREIAREAAETLVTECDENGHMPLGPMTSTILHALETAVGEKDQTIESGCLAVQQQQELINEQILEIDRLNAELKDVSLKAADRNEWQDVALKVSAERDQLKAELVGCQTNRRNAYLGEFKARKAAEAENDQLKAQLEQARKDVSEAIKLMDTPEHNQLAEWYERRRAIVARQAGQKEKV